ncbi:MAG: hypothetical protein IJ042_01965 [Butyricicoccus sp.]|nr:hypothetical protein [Butyricicoccus sp.]
MRQFGYQLTVDGREVLTACWAVGRGPDITSVEFGSGTIADDAVLADQTELLNFVAYGAVAERYQNGPTLYLTTQYASNMTEGLGAFPIGEFLVRARHPISGEIKTLLYCTLGGYLQTCAAYDPEAAPTVHEFPLELHLLNSEKANVSAPGGLVTYDKLQQVVERECGALVDVMASGGIKKSYDFTIPADGWVKDPDAEDEYAYYYDLIDEECTAGMFPFFLYDRGSKDPAADGGLDDPVAFDGYMRVYAMEIPFVDVVNEDGTITEQPVDLTATCILMAKGSYTSSGTGGAYELPVASENVLGGFRIKNGESGLNIDANGFLSVNMATGEETEDAVDDALAGNAPDSGDDGSVETTTPDGIEIAENEEVDNELDSILGEYASNE